MAAGFERTSRIPSLPVWCVFLALIQSPGAGKLHAQTPDRIRDGCGTCDIHISRVTTLRDNPAMVGVGSAISLTRSGDGLYFLAAAQFTNQVAVFDTAGRIARILGRAGKGPGEFRYVRSVTSVDTTLFVLDIGNLRVQSFSLRTEALRGQTTLPLRPNYLTVLDTETFVVNGFRYDPEGVGQLYHIINSSGEVTRSFGYEGDVVRADEQFTRLRPVAVRSNDSFWAANMTRYRLEAWNVDGDRVRVLDRYADWFAPHASTPRYDGTAEPPPHIPAIHQDSLGLLWILISVADNNWREAVRSESGENGRRVDRHAFYDTIIEAVDPRSATLLGSHRIDAYVTTFVGSRLIGVDEELPSGEPGIGIFRLDLPRATPSIRR